MWAQAKQDDERLYLRRYAYYAKDHDLPQAQVLPDQSQHNFTHLGLLFCLQLFQSCFLFLSHGNLLPTCVTVIKFM